MSGGALIDLTQSLIGSEAAADLAATQRATLFEQTGARPLSLVDRSAPAPLMVGRISPNGHTILFGPGDAGKGLLASLWITEHVRAGGKVLILDFEDHPEEWGRRIWGLGGQDALDGVTIVAPLSSATKDGAVDWPSLYRLREVIGSTVVTIDSVAYAIPGLDPSEAKAATTYSARIQPFGVPVLSLAHMNRMGDARYPFGSTFWHAGARMTWSLVPDGENGAKLQNRKHNNYEWQGAYAVTSDWFDDIPRNVHQTSYAVSIRGRIEDVLKLGPASLDEVVSALNADEGGEPVKRDTVKRTLNRELSRQWTIKDGLYLLPTSD